MSDDDFVRSLGLAFLAHRLRRVSDLIVDGTSEALRRAGFDGPPRSVSMLLLLRENGAMGVTEIGFRLRLSHPMIIKLARTLEAVGLVRDEADPADNRRRLIALTEKGIAQTGLAQGLLGDVARTFDSMFDEAGIDLFAAIERFEAVAERWPIADRLAAPVPLS